MGRYGEAFDDMRRATIENTLICGDMVLDVTEATKTIHIVRDVGFKKPAYKLVIHLRKEIYDKILEEQNVIFNLKIYETIQNDANASSVVCTRDVVLKAIVMPDLKIGDDKPLIDGTFEGFEQNILDIDILKKQINVKNKTIKDTVLYYISQHMQYLQLKFVVINTFENPQIYNEIQIPNDTFFKNLEWLAENYGFFKNSKAEIFYENKVLYIIDWSRFHLYLKNTTHRNDIHLYVRDRDSAFEDYPPNCDPVQEPETLHFVGKYKIQVNANEQQIMIGDKSNVYSENYTNPDDKPEEKSTKVNDAIKNKKTMPQSNNIVSESKPHNPNSVQYYINHINNNLVTFFLNIEGTATFNHMFNTQYKVDFQKEGDKFLSGYYRARSQTIMLKMITGGEFSVNAKIVFANINFDASMDDKTDQETKDANMSKETTTEKKKDQLAPVDDKNDWYWGDQGDYDDSEDGA